jgi:hypothetical protein
MVWEDSLQKSKDIVYTKDALDGHKCY